METFPLSLALLLALATLGSSQLLGGPGTEPWSGIVLPACAMKNIDVTGAMKTATQCVSRLTGMNPTGICKKRNERNECLRPYYAELKKCFDDDEDVDAAYEAQKAAVEFFCKDLGKKFMEIAMLGTDAMCQPKGGEKCIKEEMLKNFPDYTDLFNDKNCKTMDALLGCTSGSFKHCKSTKMSDLIVGQWESMLEASPCAESSGEKAEGEKETKGDNKGNNGEDQDKNNEEPNGASVATFASPVVLFTLVCHVFT